MSDGSKTSDAKAERLERLLVGLAKAKDVRPGVVTRRLRDAVARIPWLTAEMLTRPRIAPLAKRVGVTSTMVEQRKVTVPQKSTPQEQFLAGFIEDRKEEKLLNDLVALLEVTSPTREDIARLLEGRPPDVSRMLAEARDLQASRLARRGAAARHAPYKGKREQLRAIYASGEYPTKRACAQGEYVKLKIKYSTAIDYLKSTDPKTPPR
jgi:hypothetical protein